MWTVTGIEPRIFFFSKIEMHNVQDIQLFTLTHIKSNKFKLSKLQNYKEAY